MEFTEHRRAGHVVNSQRLAQSLPHGFDNSQHGSLDRVVHVASPGCGYLLAQLLAYFRGFAARY
jgi:hypothetical protein